jgi:hypothetical protein
MPTTFVTALVNLHEERPADKTIDHHFDLLNRLQSTGIRLHVFLSPEYRGRVSVTNGVIEYVSLEDLDTFAIAPQGLPEKRHEQHDTRNFLILMNSKTELVKRAIESRMHSSSHYAWIDSGICHVFRTPDATLRYLQTLGNATLPDTAMFVPGCWPSVVMLTHVNWRFCGGFFLGDPASLLDMHSRFRDVFPTMQHLTWEVNTWAYLESLGWNPTWYKADHNDSIVKVPYVSSIVRVPSNVPLYWSGEYSKCYPASAIEQYVFEALQKQEKPVSAVFSQSDGIIGEEELNRMIETLGRGDNANTPAEKFYSELASNKLAGTEAIVCMLCSRAVDQPNLLLLPLDDDTFNRGLNAVLSPFTIPSWESKKPLAFWRGGSSGCERPTLRMRVVDSLVDSPHVDIKFTRGGWPANDAVIPDDRFASERVDIPKHLEYKYIFILDGNCIASAHQWVFGSGSVPIMITHPENKYWFQRYLKPMVNYVPIAYDLSDLHDKLEWLVTHDAEAKTIAENAQYMARTIFCPAFQKAYVDSEINRILGKDSSMLIGQYESKRRIPSDINEHLPTLYKYAKMCDTIVECSVCEICSSYAFASGLIGNPKNVFTIVDPFRSHSVDMFTDMCAREGVNVKFIQDSDLTCPLVETDLLFIDTWHVYAQLKRELAHWHSSVKKYIIMHDTTVDEWYGESIRGNFDIEAQARSSGFPASEIAKGLWPAITEFMRDYPEWVLTERNINNNGLTVLSRRSDTVS